MLAKAKPACASHGPPERLYPGRVPCPAVEADVAVVGAGPPAAARGDHAGTAGRRSAASSTRRRSPATSAAATVSRPAPCACSSTLGLDARRVPSWQPVDAAVGAIAVGPRGRASRSRAATARSPPSPAASSSTPRSSTSPRAAGAKVLRRPRASPASRPTADARRARRRRLGDVRAALRRSRADGMWSPVRKSLGRGDAGLPRRVARVPPVLRRRRPAAPPTGCGCGSSPTSCPATPGRSRSPAAGPTSASASSATAARRIQDMKALWPDLLARPHIARRARRRSPSPRRRTRPGRSRPASTGAVLAARPRRCSSATPPRATDPHDRRGHRPGAAHRRARRPTRSSTPARCARAGASGYRDAVREHLVADHRMSVLSAGAALDGVARGGDPASPGPASGPGATSPAGCSRTSPAPSPLTPRRWHRRFLARPGAYAARGRADPCQSLDGHSRNRPPRPGAPSHAVAAARNEAVRPRPRGCVASARAPLRCGHAHATDRAAGDRAPGDAGRDGRRVVPPAGRRGVARPAASARSAPRR